MVHYLITNLFYRQVIKDTNYEQRDYEAKVQEHIAKLNSVLVNTQNELSNIRIEKEELELKLQTAPTLECKKIKKIKV